MLRRLDRFGSSIFVYELKIGAVRVTERRSFIAVDATQAVWLPTNAFSRNDGPASGATTHSCIAKQAGADHGRVCVSALANQSRGKPHHFRLSRFRMKTE
jgi:hypothetical protein